MTNRYVLSMDDRAATDIDVAGGKGASLATMRRAGFDVPDGAVIAADAYREHAAAVAPLVAELSMLDVADSRALALASARIIAALSRAHPASALADELAAAIDLDAPDAAWAVRSSATLEDLAGAAFAGQHDTYLNCIGGASVLQRVQQCWASLWTPRAIAYRAQRGLEHRDAAMAVVVQRLVRCDVAGVAFSVDPVRGDLGRVVVDANHGLGESVVAGESAVDHYAIDRATGAVVERRIARKTARIVAARTGTTTLRMVDAEADRPALDDESAAAVARLAVAAEEARGWPQDIEWGIADGRLYLLQSRPITAIAPRWTRDESAERFPNVVTPLTWDFVEDGFHRSLAHSFDLMGSGSPASRWFGCFGHYVYGNQNAVELSARCSPLAGVPAAELPSRIAELLPRLAWLLELPAAWERALPGHLAAIAALDAEPLDGRSLAELWAHVERVHAVGSEYFLPNIAISLGHGLLHRALQALVAAAVGEPEACLVVDALVSCATITTRVNGELRSLAALVERSGARETMVAADRRVVWAAHCADDAEPWCSIRSFLDAHGHRETDFDAYHPTWRDAPWVVLEQLRALLLASPARREAPGLSAEAALARIPESLRPIVAQVAHLARVYTALDDLEHYQTTRLARPMRRAVAAIGAALVGRGILDDALDPFFARRESLARAIAADDAAGWGALVAEIRAAKASWSPARRAAPAWTLGRADHPSDLAAPSAQLTGIPGSAGRAEGIVHVVHDVDDFATFAPGCVLVARTTNPAWTPLFHAAAAVVTESGGPLSHGAVTARESHIPAVMSVRGATSALRDGERVIVDGGAGTVLVVARADGRALGARAAAPEETMPPSAEGKVAAARTGEPQPRRGQLPQAPSSRRSVTI